ncbi:MBL fold metallo-hydrolase [Fictibacillus sp. KIGAM418]|uniref:MBL fold metallo-hydrolase n=1 Tax=Fictibacillus marinisediminis TaxID=2878389 RepID=A0A9X2BG30_9BACL|nr:MBL fold metallo-hydrolase [Fictibacillus marinisediminis]
MELFICSTCGVQYQQSEQPPSECIICNEERQYVNPSGQKWTTLKEMRADDFYNTIKEDEPNLYSIHTQPDFAISQTAYLVQGEGFNLLWDCITYLDIASIEAVKQLGGIDAIALSHPHYYSSQVEWAETFNVPIYIHEDDKEWVTRTSSHIHFWSGEKLELSKGLTLHHLGGHFKGGAVLHWADGSQSKGVLLTGDVIQVVADRSWVSFMYSYPNLIPLPASVVSRIADNVKDLKFNRLYNAFHRVVQENASQAVQRSAERYIKAIQGELFTT